VFNTATNLAGFSAMRQTNILDGEIASRLTLRLQLAAKLWLSHGVTGVPFGHNRCKLPMTLQTGIDYKEMPCKLLRTLQSQRVNLRANDAQPLNSAARSRAWARGRDSGRPELHRPGLSADDMQRQRDHVH
jgi:hypothetical protein